MAQRNQSLAKEHPSQDLAPKGVSHAPFLASEVAGWLNFQVIAAT
jgi:hypothetical protein